MQISGLGEHARDIYAFGVLTLKALLGPSVRVLHGDDDWEPPSALIDQHPEAVLILTRMLSINAAQRPR